MSNAPAIFVPTPTEAAPAPAPALDRVVYDSPLPRPQNDHELAEVVAAADFLSRADSRSLETLETANEIFALLGENQPFKTTLERGERNWAPHAEETGRDPATGRFTAQVPHRALHQERERRKVAEARAAELEVATARAQERLSVLNELVTAAQGSQSLDQPQHAPQPHNEFDPDRDVFQSVKYLKQQLDQRDAKDREREYIESYKADIVKFVKQVPDFFQAHASLSKSRDTELQAMGWSNPAERAKQIAREERELTRNAIAEGKSPASIVYALARGRGYGRQTAPQQQYAPETVAHIERMNRDRQASATLSGAGGAPGGGPSVSDIANMSEGDFDRLINKLGGLSDPRVRQAFGG